MKIRCACGHEYETREMPTPPGENPLVSRTEKESYTCEKCGAFNAPRLSEGVREEIGMGVMNVESVLALDLDSQIVELDPPEALGFLESWAIHHPKHGFLSFASYSQVISHGKQIHPTCLYMRKVDVEKRLKRDYYLGQTKIEGSSLTVKKVSLSWMTWAEKP